MLPASDSTLIKTDGKFNPTIHVNNNKKKKYSNPNCLYKIICPGMDCSTNERKSFHNYQNTIWMSDLPVHVGLTLIYSSIIRQNLPELTSFFALFYPSYNQLHYYEINAVKVFHEFP